MERKLSTNGVNRCVSCGSSELSFDGAWLTCAYCHHHWNTAVLADQLHLSDGIDNLVGTAVLTGAKDIDTSSLVTVKCDGCGASVTINSATTLNDTCHWCLQVLSLNSPVDNGSVPDAILPFTITRDDAINRMVAYVSGLKNRASPEFIGDFARYPIQAVYLPYLVVDGNVTATLEGQAWVDQGMAKESPYPQDCVYRTEEFTVVREADLSIDDLAIEARSMRTKQFAAVSTVNIINSIQPFDVEHAVRFDAHYITDGIVFETRDMGVDAAMDYAADHFATIARNYVNRTLAQYTGGVRWDAEELNIWGSRWVSMLLPVWLYAFEEKTPTGPMLHYIAVNGRTGETEGSVPGDVVSADLRARTWRRTTTAILATPLAFLAFGACIAALTGHADAGTFAMWAGVPLLLMAWVIVVGRDTGELHRGDSLEGLRNPDARLKPETETTFTPTRLVTEDRSLGDFTHLGGPEILERNDFKPNVRAAAFHAEVDGAPGAPLARADAPASAASRTTREKRFDASGLRVDGQSPSVPPPLGFDLRGRESVPE
jgi:ribosomal protein S27E